MIPAIKKTLVVFGSIVVLGGVLMVFTSSQDTLACGFGNPGGQAYGSPQQNFMNRSNQGQAVSKDQAVQIVTQHIKKLGPDLRIGKISDVGPLYEAEILSSSNDDILQVLGVYKQSGRLVLIN